MNVKISTTNDPFKKYWWVILVVFGLVGAFFGLSGAGSGDTPVAGGERGFKSSEQSLDASANPNGAPGGAVDLSMDGSGPYRKNDGGITSSLYQASADEAPASSATAKASGSANLANALKMVASKSNTGSADAGWGGEKAQKGFTGGPRLASAGLSGAGGVGGSLSASFSGGGGAEGLSAFGNGKANTGVDFAKGLGGGASADPAMKNATASMKSLSSAANNAVSAASQKSNDLSAAMGSRSFDGSGNRYFGGRGSSAGGDGGGPVALGGAGIYAKLDSAPKNLKGDAPKVDLKKIQPPAAAPVAPPQKTMQEMIMQMVMTGLIGAVMQGIVGSML